MPKYYCDYCDTYLTHDSPSVRKTHCIGRKHRDNVKFYYQKWMEEQAQHLIDATTAAFKAGKIAQNPFSAPPPNMANMTNMTSVPPPSSFGPMTAGNRMIPPPGKYESPTRESTVFRMLYLYDELITKCFSSNKCSRHATNYDAYDAATRYFIQNDILYCIRFKYLLLFIHFS